MSDNILVSAIIPTYNRGYVVGKAIDSVLAQTYKNIEIIVVDDGSTDDTVEQLKVYGERIRVVCQKNAGPSAARNRGIEVSRGEIIAFLDSDDIWLPAKIERQVSFFERAPSYVPCCLANGTQRFWGGQEVLTFENSFLTFSGEEILCTNMVNILATRFVLFCQLVAIRRDALERTGYYDTRFRFMEDYDLELRLSIEGPWGLIREPLGVINATSADSLSLTVLDDEEARQQYILETRTRVFETLRDRSPSAPALKQLRQTIRKARHDLWAAKLRNRGGWMGMIGRAYNTAEHYRMAGIRRSPLFPRVEGIAIPGENQYQSLTDGAETKSEPAA